MDDQGDIIILNIRTRYVNRIKGFGTIRYLEVLQAIEVMSMFFEKGMNKGFSSSITAFMAIMIGYSLFGCTLTIEPVPGIAVTRL